MRTALEIVGCPTCYRPLDPVIEANQTLLACPKHKHQFKIINGLPHLVPADHGEEIISIGEAMTAIRREEGWHKLPAETLLEDTVGGSLLLTQWRKTLAMIEFSVEQESIRLGRRLRIATIGGGVFHDAVSLSSKKHAVVAIDPSSDAFVGVRSAKRLSESKANRPGTVIGLPEAPPLQIGGPDIIILRGWLGVPSNPRPLLQTLITRVLPPGGLLIIGDMPVYKQALAADRWTMTRVAKYREELGLDEEMSRRVAPILQWKLLPILDRIDCQVELRVRWGVSSRWIRSGWSRIMGDELAKTPLIIVRSSDGLSVNQ